MYILLGPLAVTLGTISYYVWLLYLTSRLPKYDHSPRHGHSPKQSQLVKLGRLPDVSATFFQKHPRRFMSLTLAFIVLGICVMTAWSVLTFIRGGCWAIAFGTTPALLSMLRELTWEWGKVLRDTMAESEPLLCMMMQATVLGATCVAFGIRLARPWWASIYTEILTISYGFVLLDLAMLLMSTLRLRRRYATAVKKVRAAFAAVNSTASLAEELARSIMQYPPAVRIHSPQENLPIQNAYFHLHGACSKRAQRGGDRTPNTDLNDKGLWEYQTTVHEENEGVELTAQDVV
ncbi:uncharacterized protein NECHADRAFT_88454 [Fusarium vanettenii 77-13-4]|uniref:Transmembrane protein n=1 Tax=Fusarium vanettenii (strain ATCC MYA-4622 / CBS 123669 / FGSC 9596 / NRRL 45880 / 77-13-4) TaxID=660122 RepID=C7ZBK1_FUSV7|nr:uncharacterized protein NECHADRAFT_88454 [Fusarium vanettenii 77-13-4]EEU38541.1 predicted protein [Fusarium vanettenii 77-13-4]